MAWGEARKVMRAEGIRSVPKSISLDLSVVRTNQRFSIAGDVFGVWSSPTVTDQILVRFNAPDEPAIPFTRGQTVETPFRDVYITVPGTDTGTMTLVYGSGGAEFLRLYNASQDVPAVLDSLLTSNEGILDELRGETAAGAYGQIAVGVAAVQVLAANGDRVGCIVTADPTNANPVYLGFTNAVAANNCFAAFAAGAYDRVHLETYRGPIYAIAGGAANAVGYGEWE